MTEEEKIELGRWWNATIVPVIREKTDELMAQGKTRAQANDNIVFVMLEAIRRRHQRQFDMLKQKG